MNPTVKPQTVCIHISPAARQSLVTQEGGAKRYVSRPPPRTAMPAIGSFGLDGASYQEFFQNLYDAAMITGANGEIIDANPRAVEFFQYEISELRQLQIVDLISGSDQSLLGSIQQNFENQTSTYIEAYCERKDETLFSAEIIVNKLKHIKTGAYCFFVRDATRRRHAEETLAAERNLLRTLIDSLPDYIYVKDNENRYILDNIAHRQHLRLDEGEDVQGRTVYDYYPKEVADQFNIDDEQLIQTGQAIVNREELFTGPNHEPIWVLTSKMPIFDDSGQVMGSVGISRDITHYKLSDEKLREAAEKLEKNNRELQDFAYIASHDLQEPLRKIQAFGDRIKAKASGQLDPESLDYLQRMQNAAGRMQTLINNLLTLSRVTTKARPFEPVDLNKICREVISDLEVRIEQTSGKIESVDLPIIQGDPIQMRQLFQNIISNALKFHKPDEPPVITINYQLFRDPLNSVETPDSMICHLTIRDNGIGFDEKYAETIFAPFHRLHGREEYEGTGIGLAICRKIVERHGGTIVAESSPGNGSTFVIQLPFQPKPNR